MEINQKKFVLSSAFLLGLSLGIGCNLSAQAATPMDLRHQDISALQSFVSVSGPNNRLGVKEISRHLDFKKTLHVRVQETYSGYKVWGADAVIHIPHAKTNQSLAATLSAGVNAHATTMDGTFYQDLATDLASAPQIVFEKAQAQRALQYALDTYQHQAGAKPDIQDQQSQLIVFIDKNKKAHWSYKVSFFVTSNKANNTPAKPTYIMDAISFHIYAQWDDVKTIETSHENGGGFGGNIKMGKLVYDGAVDNLAMLSVQRDNEKSICYLENADVRVEDSNTNTVMSFGCKATDAQHNQVYWDGDFDAVNGGYSPGNDALFSGQVIKHMYQDWYHIPVLKNADGSPMLLTMVVHVRKYDNAFWDGKHMVFGDGATLFYPLTSLGVASHEISHGFTEQHSGLEYYDQSGGMNEAFSDMAAQAAEHYAYGVGKNSWQIAPEIFKAKDEALRYMDQPSKDCGGRKPGRGCSIDDASQYNDSLDVHHSSGVYNHFFYLLSTTKGWNVKMAFDVMVLANSDYWTSLATFESGACGAISATKDLGYNVDDVKTAFTAVKIKTKQC